MKLTYLSLVRLPTKNAHGLQIMKMCESFSQAGLDVELLIPQRFNQVKDNPFSFYGVRENFKIKRILAIDLYPVTFLPEKVSATILSFSFFISARIYLWFRPTNLVYTREIFWSLFSTKFIFEAHNFPRKTGPFYHWLFGRMRLFVVLNSYLKDNFIQNGVATDKILISPDAVDKNFFSAVGNRQQVRQDLDLPLDKKIVLYSGNFYDWKGVDTLAYAIKLLPAEVFFVLLGATKESDLERIKGIVSACQNVRVLSYVPHREVPGYISAADILVLPNSAKEDISSFFTSPLKLFEYMASGRAIVSSDLPSLREILNESNCVFFEPDNVTSLAMVINSLLNNPALAQTLATQALVDSKKYTWENRAKSILNFIGR